MCLVLMISKSNFVICARVLVVV